MATTKTTTTTTSKLAFVITWDWASVQDYVMDMDKQGYEVHILTFKGRDVSKILEFPSLIHSAGRVHVLNEPTAQGMDCIANVLTAVNKGFEIAKKEKKDIAARLVPLSEIEDNNFDLNIGRYLKADAAEVVDVSEALGEFNQARGDLDKLEKELIAKLKAAGYA
jgi:type I restriction enzyme M protein